MVAAGREGCSGCETGSLRRGKPDRKTRIGSAGGNPLRNWRAKRPTSMPFAPPSLTRQGSAMVSGSAISSCCFISRSPRVRSHRDLLLESPVKLPFLNVELPLNAFFILGPLVFLVVHAYVLLHFLLLAGKVGAFHAELEKQVREREKRAQLRRQLPSNIFVQFLAGPREVREGVVGFLLKSVALISLVAGPVALLILFQLQFLPYHSPSITWWQRIAVVLDLVLLWLLWPPIARGETALLTWDGLARARVAAWLPPSLQPLLLVFAIATFPGEWLEESILPGVRLIPTTLEA